MSASLLGSTIVLLLSVVTFAQFSGDITYYTTADGTGACSFDKTSSVLIAALNAPQWSNSGNCGKCARISGPKGNITVRIVDKCPECKTGDLDLHPSAFTQLAEKSLGRVKVSWNWVVCPVEQPGIQYKFKEGSNDYWVAIQIRNHRIGIAKLQVREGASGTSFADFERKDYNYFIRDYSSGIKKPFTIRVTAEDGQTINDTISSFAAGDVKQSNQQFMGTPESSTVKPKVPIVLVLLLVCFNILLQVL